MMCVLSIDEVYMFVLALHELADVNFQQFCSKIGPIDSTITTPSNCDVIVRLLIECPPKPW